MQFTKLLLLGLVLVSSTCVLREAHSEQPPPDQTSTASGGGGTSDPGGDGAGNGGGDQKDHGGGGTTMPSCYETTVPDWFPVGPPLKVTVQRVIQFYDVWSVVEQYGTDDRAIHMYFASDENTLAVEPGSIESWWFTPFGGYALEYDCSY